MNNKVITDNDRIKQTAIERKESLRRLLAATGLNMDGNIFPYYELLYKVWVGRDDTQVRIAEELISNNETDLVEKLFFTDDDFLRPGICSEAMMKVLIFRNHRLNVRMIDDTDKRLLDKETYFRADIQDIFMQINTLTENRPDTEKARQDLMKSLHKHTRMLRGFTLGKIVMEYLLVNNLLEYALHTFRIPTRIAYRAYSDEDLARIVKDPKAVIMEPKGLINSRMLFEGLDLSRIKFKANGKDEWENYKNTRGYLSEALKASGYVFGDSHNHLVLTDKFDPNIPLDFSVPGTIEVIIPSDLEIDIRRRLADSASPDRIDHSIKDIEEVFKRIPYYIDGSTALGERTTYIQRHLIPFLEKLNREDIILQIHHMIADAAYSYDGYGTYDSIKYIIEKGGTVEPRHIQYIKDLFSGKGLEDPMVGIYDLSCSRLLEWECENDLERFKEAIVSETIKALSTLREIPWLRKYGFGDIVERITSKLKPIIIDTLKKHVSEDEAALIYQSIIDKLY